jgi:DMSO/TMAO reductase YedYZ heme-binding membrane subunit
MNNNKEIEINTDAPCLCEFYLQLSQSVNTNAIERTTFLSVYIAMIAIIVLIIDKTEQGFFLPKYIPLYVGLVGITLLGIILLIKINYIIYERQFLANQIRQKCIGKIYEEYYPPYIKNMSIDLLVVTIMFIFLSIFLFALLQCLPFHSILYSTSISFSLFCLLTIMYGIHRRFTKRRQLLRISREL